MDNAGLKSLEPILLLFLAKNAFKLFLCWTVQRLYVQDGAKNARPRDKQNLFHCNFTWSTSIQKSGFRCFDLIGINFEFTTQSWIIIRSKVSSRSGANLLKTLNQSSNDSRRQTLDQKSFHQIKKKSVTTTKEKCSSGLFMKITSLNFAEKVPFRCFGSVSSRRRNSRFGNKTFLQIQIKDIPTDMVLPTLGRFQKEKNFYRPLMAEAAADLKFS